MFRHAPGGVEKIVSRKKRENRSGRFLNELFCFAAKIFSFGIFLDDNRSDIIGW